MSGALVELVAKGSQDAYLTGNPEVSFFHQQYKRHTNFAQKPVQVNYTGTAGATQQISLKLLNKGDLLGYVWMDMNPFNVDTTLSASTSPSSNIGALQDSIFELYIGGQLIDRQDGFYMSQLWQKFLLDSSAKGFALSSDDFAKPPLISLMQTTWMPLHFFFCDACYLPLVALQYHEVEIRITFGSLYVLARNGSGAATIQPNFYANYVVLDTDERAIVVDKNQDILIEQVQRISAISPASLTSNTANKFDLSMLNHPVKCLLWGQTLTNAATFSPSFTTQTVQLYLNGTELFESVMPDAYFSFVQTYYHSEFASSITGGQQAPAGLYNGQNLKMYSFALKANKHQPCGTCNFSRLDTASMTIGTVNNAASTNFYLYAVNFNILRIKSGMAGLAFSN